MKETFRKSMLLLHTWSGVIIGGVLFAIFWMGALSVFDREIDRWMLPATRMAAAPTEISLDKSIKAIVEREGAGSPQYGILMPTERVPMFRFTYRDRTTGEFAVRYIDPRSGTLLPNDGSYAGTGFIYPFHYMLHLRWRGLGYWLVGLAAMAMLTLLVTGVVIHHKIFTDFFTFRPDKALPRSSLDLHNLTGVLALPFHFVMTLSGLIIFLGVYYPFSITAPYVGDRAAFNKEVYGQYRREAAKKPGGPMASLDGMMAEAQRQWGDGKPYFLRVWNPGDANAYVEVRRSYANNITLNLDQLYFDAATGALLSRFEAKPVVRFQRFVTGLHLVQFNHWSLRWLYFFGGLTSCVLIATGFLFWMESRRKRHETQGLAGVRVVEALTVGGVTGIVIATLAFFIANRLLPQNAAHRADLEVWGFYLSWLAAFIHAALRPSRKIKHAFIEQAWAIAALAVCGVGLNWATTGDHLAETLMHRKWAIAGMDLMLLGAALIAALVARRMARVSASEPVRKPIVAPATVAAQEASNA